MGPASTAAILLTLVCIVQGFHTAKEQQQHVCAFFSNNGDKSYVSENDVANDDVSEDDVIREIEATTDPEHVRCQSACYTAITDDPITNGTKIIKQGCWEPSGRNECDRTACAPERRPRHKNPNMRFCCCIGDMCNANITDTILLEEEPAENDDFETIPQKAAHESGRATLVVGMSVLVAVSIGSLVLVALYCFWRGVGMQRSQKPEPDSMRLMENGQGPGQGYGQIMGSYTGDKIKFLNTIGQGRYGCVWRATVGDREVAVKVFPPHYRSYFLNERDIYCLPFMAECNSLLTYYGCDERPSMDGSPEYLLVLSYSPNGCLQDYLRSNTVDWPTFCRMALTIAKGLAHLHTDMRKGEKDKPCVSHRDLNTRNILVNADLSCSLCDLGFAMKIVGSKYYQNGEEQHAETKSINDVGTMRYMAPEVLEGAVNLRDCESSLKQIDVYALALVLWELACRCSDLYQPGSEVPPYSMPFESEIGHHPTFEQMQVLIVRHKARPLFPDTWRDWTAVRLIKETMEDCWDQDAEARLTALCVEERCLELPALWERQRSGLFACGISPTLNPTQGLHMIRGTINNPITNNTNSSVDVNILIVDSNEDTGGQSTSSQKDTQESTVSEGTVETLLTLSPSDPPDYSKCWPKGPLQPYQGRNPCMERNLMPPAASEEELGCQGTILVDRSSKHTPQGHYRSGSSCNESQALVSNDFLNQSQQQQNSQLNTSSNLRPITPIPYVQNVVCSSQPSSAEDSSAKRGMFSSWTGGLRKLFESKKKVPNGAKDDAWKLGNQEGLDGRLNILPGRETQVLLNRPTGVITTVLDADENRSEREANQSSSQPIPVSHIVSPALRPTTLPLLRSKGLSNNNSKKRLSAECQDLFASSSVDWKLKDPTLRVKTPGDVPASVRKNRGRGFAARFSLYDDRIMGGNDLPANNSSRPVDLSELEKDGVLEVCIPSMFSSVPYQINTVSDSDDVNDSMF